jgi:uncharacterized protein
VSKLLTLILVIVVAWWLTMGSRRRNASRKAPRAVPRATPEQKMVKCNYCGLYLPQSEAIAEADKFFCCAEHRRQAG